MGHNSKKKKRGGGTGRRRASNNDHTSIDGVGGELLTEELTALRAIFQEDCDILSESPPRIKIKLRPYSQDSCYEDLEVSALLSIRFLPGYPYKCPKILIIPENGLSKCDADNLLSLLHDQATLNAREGRVMIYNLVEAAQEFLSEVVPLEQPHFSQKNVAVSCDRPSKGPFVYGFLDLFIGSEESWNWELSVEENSSTNTAVNNLQNDGQLAHENVNQDMKIGVVEDGKLNEVLSCRLKLLTLEEESKSTESLTSESGELVENASIGEDYPLAEDTEDETDYDESKSDHSASSASMDHHQISHTVERDLILAHLLRLTCASKGSLAGALTDVTSELVNLGIVSDRVADLATESSSGFDRSFNQAFGHRMVTSKISQFWKTASDTNGQHASQVSSRYLNDFEELQPLGHGGFGHVVLCKNKLDGRQYAVKKIRLKDKSEPLDDRILREVATLSRLQHQHVVRYYQAWFEIGDAGCYGDSKLGSRTASFSYIDQSLTPTDNLGQENKVATYLYIQMEYCPRTLRQKFDSYSHFDKKLAWHLFRQIVEGLAHIHGQGIIHRDLTPNNIFFDARNDIKIGDFGLAKFLKLEQLEQDLDHAETNGVSVDGTGQIGTYFYTAPEIEQRWPKINEKADMYSLGIVFLELWHPFSTGMERHIVLSDLKKKGELPLDWVSEFPEQASLLRRMMSSSPSDRPSATELLQNAFPPRMEFELLDNMLRTMHNPEDTGIRDKVVNALFNDDILSTKYQDNVDAEIPKLRGSDTSFILQTDLDTEIRDLVWGVSAAVFRLHCARRLEIIPMRLLADSPQFNRNTVKLLTNAGDMIEFCHELRLPFINWVVLNQKSSFKRFEICYVHRKSIGHSPPNRYLQGDFDVIGGASALTEAEVIKAAMDIINRFFHQESCDIHLNHGDLLEAIWSWIGIKADHRQKVAELLSLLGSLRPQSTERKTKWVVIRRQLRQELNISEGVVNKLQTVGLRFCGIADQALPRLRGALPADTLTRKALDELSQLCNYLRIWKIEKHVFIDPLMPPTEAFHRDSFFQIYLSKDNSSLGSHMEGTLLAVGGRYDYLLQHKWQSEYKSKPPGAVGTSLALETIIQHSSVDIYRPFRNDSSRSVLVCSRGGGGLLEKRMELVAELWEDNIKAEFVPILDPSLTEQYEYANEHDIKCLIIISDTGESQKGSVKIRHLELKRETEVSRESLVKFLSEAISSQFRNPSIWN